MVLTSDKSDPATEFCSRRRIFWSAFDAFNFREIGHPVSHVRHWILPAKRGERP
jgi:hypothetical protein